MRGVRLAQKFDSGLLCLVAMYQRPRSGQMVEPGTISVAPVNDMPLIPAGAIRTPTARPTTRPSVREYQALQLMPGKIVMSVGMPTSQGPISRLVAATWPHELKNSTASGLPRAWIVSPMALAYRRIERRGLARTCLKRAPIARHLAPCSSKALQRS
jgi:hypothetical protein